MGKLEKGPARAAKAHIRYKAADGGIVPGVTTVLGIINKPALVKWANTLGLQGIDSTAYVDETAKIGTLAHEMIQAYLGGPEINKSAYTPEQIDAAENSIISFFEWEKGQGRISTESIELPIVSEENRYGGTIDWYGWIDGKKWLVDIKTCKTLYPEHEWQVAAYYHAMIELGYHVDGVRLLRVGRTEDEGFDDHVIAPSQLKAGWRVFEAALNLYRAKQQYERKKGAV